MPAAAHPDATVLIYVALAILGLLVLVAYAKLHAFVSLMIASLFTGLAAGLPLMETVKAFQDGLGGVLSSIAVIVGLGAMIGKLLAESGGARVIATTLTSLLGPKLLPWSVLIASFVIGLPVFFAVGLVLLSPILYSLARASGKPLLLLGIPMVAGLAAAHGLVPPHPGPMLAIELVKADTGKTILYSILVGFPAAVIAGPFFGRIIAQRVPGSFGPLAEAAIAKPSEVPAPGFFTSLFTICLPILLMVFGSIGTVALPKGNALREILEFLGSPAMAMLLAFLFALWVFGYQRGFRSPQLAKFIEDSLLPVASILLIVGGGGGFSKVLINAGAGAALGHLLENWQISPLLMAWLLAVSVRVATGSATIAAGTAAGIIFPSLDGHPEINRELVVLALGSGSLILSHLNDGGFWFVKEYFNLTVTETLKSWTVMETILSVVSFLFILLLDRFI